MTTKKKTATKKKATAKKRPVRKTPARVERKSKKKTKKKAARKSVGGRPSKFKPEFEHQVKTLAELGATDAQIAQCFGVTEQTLNNWKKSHPRFFESLKSAKEIADERVEQSLFNRALGFSHPEEKIFCDKGDVVRAGTMKQYPPDTTACIFWLKNRKSGEWRDKIETEHSGVIGGNLVIADLEDAADWETAAKRQQEIMKAGIE